MSGAVDCWWRGPSQLAESPLWSPADAAFFWVDITARRIWRHDGSARPARCWQLPQPVGCIALNAAGGLIAAVRDGVYAVRLCDDAPAELTLIARAEHGPGLRFNDGRCDRQGRFWVGNLHDVEIDRQPLGRIARLSLPGEAPQPWQPALRESMWVPNGLGFSPDGRRLYFSDSHASVATVWACDYDPERGAVLGEARVFIDALPRGRPDGAAVDAEGGYWICANDGGAVLRYRPDGRLDRHIELPAAKPTMCAFGGADLSTLLVTSMQGRGTNAAADPLAGALFAVRPGVSGLAETPFSIRPEGL